VEGTEKQMKGLILAGGEGTRLKPLTDVTNKHLLPVYDKPMIYYPIHTLKAAGITDIMIITNHNHAGALFSLLGSGKKYGVHFTYRVQDEPLGIPHAIALSEKYIGSDNFVSINGDNILIGEISEYVKEFETEKEGARILLYKAELEQARKGGVAVFNGKKLKCIVEKPENPPSEYISIGVYFFTPSVFNIIRRLKPSKRGEYEITDVHNTYIERNSLQAGFFRGTWFDAGTINELLDVNYRLSKLMG
jgi:glucose-1-phosphate thymidylyltransferase